MIAIIALSFIFLLSSRPSLPTSAFNRTMERLNKMGNSLKNFTYDNKEIADEIYAAVNSTQFLGVSVCKLFCYSLKIAPFVRQQPQFFNFNLLFQGVVAFSSQGDRIALTQIEQVIDGKYVKLGYYDTQSDNLTWRNVERWIGGKVPQDRTIIRTVLRTVSLPLFISMAILSTLGIVIAIGLIVFNVYNRHRRYTILYYIYLYILYRVPHSWIRYSTYTADRLHSLQSIDAMSTFQSYTFVSSHRQHDNASGNNRLLLGRVVHRDWR